MSRIEAVFNKLYSYGMCYGASGMLPVYVVTEYPKSGGTWLTQMIAEYLDLPFYRNEKPRFEANVMHGHYRYFATMRNVVVLDRDGRDIMVSFYFHSFFRNDLYNEELVKRMRRELVFENYEDIEANLPKFIQYKFTKKRPPRFTWREFVESWRDKNACRLKYENLLMCPDRGLERAVEYLTGKRPDTIKIKRIVQKYSFKNLAKRDPGKENRMSFIRKGIAGDWVNYFNKESRQIFDHYAGEALIDLGYEKDHSWV